MITFHKNNQLKIIIFTALALSLLLIPGIINLKVTHNNPTVVESMLKGSDMFFPFYIINFIFPNRVQLPSIPVDVPSYNLQSSLLPSDIKIVNATSQNVHGSDTITLEYHGNSSYSVFSCSGSPLGPNETMRTLYFIDADDNLSCADLTSDSALLTNAHVMIENVDAMRILYGVDTDENQVANVYLAANDPSLSMNKAMTIKINLLLRTFESDPDSPISDYYKLGNETVGPFKAKYPRRILIFILPVNRGSP